MNADRIIVVENGEIIEQGNHNELIVSGGRYADLWSKQVFVRPSDETKSTDDSVGQAGIVNDLSSEQTRNELSKVKTGPIAEEAGESSQQNGGDEKQVELSIKDDSHEKNGDQKNGDQKNGDQKNGDQKNGDHKDGDKGNGDKEHGEQSVEQDGDDDKNTATFTPKHKREVIPY